MRDGIINISAIVDEEESAHDLVTKPSRLIPQRTASYAENSYADKWSLLFMNLSLKEEYESPILNLSIAHAFRVNVWSL